MYMLALIGFLGGLITGISPCILPVIPVIFFSGADSGRHDQSPLQETEEHQGSVATAIRTKRSLAETLRPYRVIGGLVLSFSVVTLAGSALLSLLHLPQDAIRWLGIAALTVIGLGLIFPQFEDMLERPFARIPQWNVSQGRSGFGLGLALGLLFVPCAGPVLAAIVLAGATGSIGINTVVLTMSFAIGTAIPLLAFALAGQRISERVGAFRRRQRQIRVVGGIVMLAFAMAIALNVPAALQRMVPDYTSALQDRVGGSGPIADKLDLGGLVNDQNRQLSNCTNGAAQLENCGPAPDVTGITGWFNTPGNAPLDLKSLRGKVVLIDFWAYSCINCQRAIPHVTDWYSKYKNAGLEVIGVHSPEYAFEKVPGNVVSGAADLGITYPVALDNKLSTWTNYRNRYWPAEYLIDASGTVRHIKFGEGDYNVTENLIRQLLHDADPGASLPPPSDFADATPPAGLTPETYFSVGKVVNYGGGGTYDAGTATFDYPATLADDTFALRGPFTLDYQGALAAGDMSSIELNFNAKNVYLVVGGQGTVTVEADGKTRAIPISGPPTSHQLIGADQVGRRHLEVRLSKGLQAFSFTYG
ncbi:cytochrome c biogenesis protein DipZ [Mycolicibacterium komossense]|uniref:Cytochrome c biogenesis protein DipZ n=1 Tax=Mycolicibacterium komossense TaxID=1779 RepID=A0ABT3CIS0_9MYCO|nr:cytochrome c biogenesis protein DipZ [Mycolicibacterium komossense]MCV7229431.1 cytochrome c biogenesis protein DipZ [Mycolicibacterium komossense]